MADFGGASRSMMNTFSMNETDMVEILDDFIDDSSQEQFSCCHMLSQQESEYPFGLPSKDREFASLG